MTRDRAKEMLPIIEGFIAGKVIQYRNAQGEWEDCFYQTDMDFDRSSTSYRVKPEHDRYISLLWSRWLREELKRRCGRKRNWQKHVT